MKAFYFLVLRIASCSAEQRMFLRAGRNSEAMPLITLPQSLLLQDTSKNGKHAMAQSSAATSLGATASGEAYGHELWNAVQEGTKTVVDEAREAFFASGASAATTATTSVAPQNTPDPAVLAKQLKISLDAAKSRILLLGMINSTQTNMLEELDSVSEDLKDTERRVRKDWLVTERTFKAAAHLPIIARQGEAAVNSMQKHEKLLHAQVDDVNNTASENVRIMTTLLGLKDKMQWDMAAAKAIKGGKPRVDTNYQTLSVLSGRLEHLAKRVTRVSAQLYDGNTTQLVDDTSGDIVHDVMEDVPRAFMRFLPAN